MKNAYFQNMDFAASRWHSRGQRFDPAFYLHQRTVTEGWLFLLALQCGTADLLHFNCGRRRRRSGAKRQNGQRFDPFFHFFWVLENSLKPIRNLFVTTVLLCTCSRLPGILKPLQEFPPKIKLPVTTFFVCCLRYIAVYRIFRSLRRAGSGFFPLPQLSCSLFKVHLRGSLNHCDHSIAY